MRHNFWSTARFVDLEDLNQQALQWATVRMENRPASKTRLIPAKAFEHERHYLTEVPAQLPGPCAQLPVVKVTSIPSRVLAVRFPARS